MLVDGKEVCIVQSLSVFVIRYSGPINLSFGAGKLDKILSAFGQHKI